LHNRTSPNSSADILIHNPSSLSVLPGGVTANQPFFLKISQAKDPENPIPM
jgi:hypothetical protein